MGKLKVEMNIHLKAHKQKTNKNKPTKKADDVQKLQAMARRPKEICTGTQAPKICTGTQAPKQIPINGRAGPTRNTTTKLPRDYQHPQQETQEGARPSRQ